MTVTRARIIKASASANASTETNASARTTLARRVPAVVVDARTDAVRITSEASAAAAEIVAEARASVASVIEAAAREAREQEIARIAAELIALRLGEEQRAERDLERTIEIAVLLAERLVGDAIALAPDRVAALAQGALQETRGARQVRIEAHADDVVALETMLASLGDGIFRIEPSSELTRGSLVIHTELGRVDARLAPQLARLAEALREALRGSHRTRQ